MNNAFKILILLLTLMLGVCPLAKAQTGVDSSRAIRLAVVITPQYSGLIDVLIEDFKKASGIPVQVYSGTDVLRHARSGKADMVIVHYGKKGVEQFVLEGYGAWPKLIFSNQAVLIGPKTDPAKVRNLSNVATALKRIAKVKAPFVSNSGKSMAYLEKIFWQAAGQPDKGNWFMDTGVGRGKAVRLAEKLQAYVMWGAYPFLRYKGKHNSKLEIMVSADPLLQRVMAAIIINPEKIEGANVHGATLFLDYLLNPKTQAKIAAFRSPGCNKQLWWPAGRDN